MKARWHLKDIIDLEYLFHLDASLDTDTLLKRDRQLFLEHIQPRLDVTPERTGRYRRKIIHLWLEARRQQEASIDGEHPDFPGKYFEDGYRLAILGICFIALLSGSGLALSFLTAYHGSQALNIFSYISVLVLPQILLVGLFLLVSVLRRKSALVKQAGLLYPFMASLLLRMVNTLTRTVLKHLPATQRDGIRAAFGVFKLKRTLYGDLFYWPVAALSQAVGIAFNLGILGATILRVLITDLAFGWQSTVQFSPQAVYQGVHLLALPWGWLFPPPVGHPTLDQVIGTKIILKEGMAALATPDLVSWWPFLCLSVCFYALLPRLVFFGGVSFVRRRVLDRFEFRQADCEALLLRLQTPRVSTQAHETSSLKGRPPEAVRSIPPSAAALRSAPGAITSALVLIPEDIADQVAGDIFRRIIRERFGLIVSHLQTVLVGPGDKARLASEFSVSGGNNGYAGHILVLLEAWLPPIRETLNFINDLRAIGGTEAPITITLIGKPMNGTILTPVAAGDWNVWKREIDHLGDPYLRLERLIVA